MTRPLSRFDNAISRLLFLHRAGTISAAAAASTLATVNDADARVPEHKTQAPGFYRLMLGEFEITALCDGTIDFAMDRILTNAKPGEVDALFREACLTSPIRTSVNQFLINTGSKLVLVDAGAGALLGPALGQLIPNLRAAGYEPEQIDEVLITHLHVDHVGGLSRGGTMIFPNATVRVNKHDIAYWLEDANGGEVPAALKENFEADKDSLAPYVAAGRVRPFNGNAVFMPGIEAVPAFGHTPGHSFYRIESKGQQLLLFGDTIHAAAVQFVDPSVTVIWDSNPKRAETQRAKILAAAAKDGFLTGGSHIAFPGIGHVRAQSSGYAWIPLNYSASL